LCADMEQRVARGVQEGLNESLKESLGMLVKESLGKLVEDKVREAVWRQHGSPLREVHGPNRRGTVPSIGGRR